MRLFFQKTGGHHLASCKARKFLFIILLVMALLPVQPAQNKEPVFDWRRYEGTKIGVLLNTHTYSEMMIAEFVGLERLTGIKVELQLSADKLGRLANNFEEKAILALVEEYTDRRK